MNPVTYCLHSTMEFYSAIMIASLLLGRAVVLSHGMENRVADWYLHLLHSKVSVIIGDIPSQVSNKGV